MTEHNTVSRELLRQVIDSLEATCGHRCNAEYNPCHEQDLVWQLRNALEQPAVEPVAWKHDCAALLTNDVELWVDRCPHCGKPRPVTAPQAQPRKAVKLTTDEYTALAHRIASKYTHRSDPAFAGYTFLPHTLEQFVRAVEQVVLKKNGVTE